MGEALDIQAIADEIVRNEANKVRAEESARVWAVGDSPVSDVFDGTGILYASDDEPCFPTVRELLADRTRFVAGRFVAGRFLARVLRSR